jgi:hypothetical protein
MGAGTHAHDCEACEDGTVPVPRSDLAAERLAALLDAERENTALRTKVAQLEAMNAALVQTSADLCPECGWRFFVPDNGCQKCELDRFRAQSVIGSEARARAWDEGGDIERAAVVAWLREYEGHSSLASLFALMADTIERGEHRKEDK